MRLWMVGMIATGVIGFYRGGGLIIVIASWLFGVFSLYRLLASGHYVRFLAVLFVYSAVACLLYLGFRWSGAFEDGDARVWASWPLIILALVFAMSGYILFGHVEKVLDPRKQVIHPPSTRIRLVGGIVASIGLAVWYCGVLHPYEGGVLYVALVVSGYSMVLGLPLLLTGRRFRDLGK